MSPASTGEIGLAQRVNAVVESYWKSKGNSSKDAITIAKDHIIQIQQDFAKTGLNVLTGIGTLIAYVAGKKFVLCEHRVGYFQPELKTNKLWYASMGSGQYLCDPFLGFLRRVFWKDHQPTLAEGIFAVTWALQQAIDLNTGGIAGPIQLATLSLADGTRPVAKTVPNDDLSEHVSYAKAAENYLSRYRDVRQSPHRASDPAVEWRAGVDERCCSVISRK